MKFSKAKIVFVGGLSVAAMTLFAASACTSVQQMGSGSVSVSAKENVISGLTDITAVCGDSFPELELNATYGQVSYKIAEIAEGAEKEELVYVEPPAELAQGNYYIRAFVEETDEYEGAVAYATLTVNHRKYEDIEGAPERIAAPEADGNIKGYSVKRCECGEEIHGDETVLVTVKIDGETADTQTVPVGGSVSMPATDKIPVREGYEAVLYKGNDVYVGGEIAYDFMTIELSAHWFAVENSFSYGGTNKIGTDWLFMPVEVSGASGITNDDIYKLSYAEGGAKVDMKFLSAYPDSAAALTLGDVKFDEYRKIRFTVKSGQGTFIWFGDEFEEKRYMISDEDAGEEIVVEIGISGGYVYVSYNGQKINYPDWTLYNLNGMTFKILDKNGENENYFENSGNRYDVFIGNPYVIYDYRGEVFSLIDSLPSEVDTGNAESVYETIVFCESVIELYFTSAEKTILPDFSAVKEAAARIVGDHISIAMKMADELPDFEKMNTATAAEQDEAYKNLARYLAYVNVKFSEEEKAVYVEPEKISFYRYFFAGRDTIVSDAYSGIETNMPAWTGNFGKFNPNNSAYEVTLPKIAFGAYEKVSVLWQMAISGAGESYTIICGDLTCTTTKDTQTAVFTVVRKEDGYYLSLAFEFEIGDGTEIKLDEAVVLGNEGISFSLSNTAWGWTWVYDNKISGTLDLTGAAEVNTVTYIYMTDAGEKQFVQYYLNGNELALYSENIDSYTDLIGKHTFIGFFAENSDIAVADGLKVNSNLILTARYEVKEEDYIDYQVLFFDDEDGEVIDSETKNYHYGDSLILPESYPQKTTNQEGKHYEFVGWFDLNGRRYTGEEKIEGPLELYAKFNLVDDVRAEFKITLTNLAESDSVSIVYDGDIFARPNDPVREGYIFAGWYTENGTEYDFSSAVTEDLLLIAKWKIYAPISARNVTVIEGIIGQLISSAVYESGRRTLTGAADNTYEFELPEINYKLYSEVSCILYFGQANTGYTIKAYGVTFENVGTAWNWLKVIYVGPEGKAIKNNTETLSEGYYLAIGNTNIGEEWYTYVKLSDDVVNGKEGLKFSVTTNDGAWDWMKIRQDGSSEADNIAGRQIYEYIDSTACTLTEDSDFEELKNYLDRVADMTAYEKAHYEEPEIVKTLRAKYSGMTVTVIEGLTEQLISSAVYESGRRTLTGAADNTYEFELPEINYALYSEVSCILYFGQANTGYTIRAYGVTFENVGTAWNWLKVIYVGPEGKAIKNNTETLSEGYYLAIGNTNIGEEWYTYVKLSDDVVNGKEGLKFSVTTNDGAWDWMKIRQDGSSEESNLVGKAG